MKDKPKARHYRRSANWLRRRVPRLPKTAIVLGSGLGAFADRAQDAISFLYADIPHFPHSTVHHARLLWAEIDGEPVWILRGRIHCYEGYQMWQSAYPIGVLHLLGVENLILTNAAGAVSRELCVGDLVCVTDHIKLTAESPCTGGIYPLFGERFFTLESVYDKTLLQIARECAATCGITPKEGVYAYMGGPQYETAAEVRMLGVLGADLVGMSTVAEVIFAAQCGIKVLCLSCVTNLGVGLQEKAVAHADVERIGKERSAALCAWLDEILRAIHTRKEER